LRFFNVNTNFHPGAHSRAINHLIQYNNTGKHIMGMLILFKSEMGDSTIKNEMILNENGYYILTATTNSKTYSFMPCSLSFFSSDSLLSYADTSTVSIETTGNTKDIQGYECKEIIISSKASGGSIITIWYIDDDKNRNLIMGTGLGYNLKGLMLEMSSESNEGKNVYKAKTIELSPVNNSEFIPTLKGYTLLNPN
jgi:hypothetical protein